MTGVLRVAAGGVLPVDKPIGPTSHDVVGRARQALGTRKVGHTGTLDPFASGLLLLCVDAATRLAEYLSGLDKSYEATAILGERTDTLDPEGTVLERDAAWRELDRHRVQAALSGFVGDIGQVPPQFSAKKVRGEAMYERARRGETVRLAPVPVRIDSMELLEIDLPRIRFRLRCSSGTYVRAVARDLARALGTCGHLTQLRRTRVGSFRVEDAVTLDDLADPGRIQEAWIPPGRAVADLPIVRVDEARALRLAQGQRLDVSSETGADVSLPEGVPLAVHLDDTLIAVAERNGPSLRPKKVFLRV